VQNGVVAEVGGHGCLGSVGQQVEQSFSYFPHRIHCLAAQFQIHPNLVYKWRKQLLDGAIALFDTPQTPRDPAGSQAEIALLYEQIGRLNVELDWLNNKVD
jgi:transposase-like protein